MDSVSKAWFKAKEALLAQSEKSLDFYGNCMYRGEGGAKCFVGHLIDDEHYSFGIEHLTLAASEVQKALANSGWELNREFLEIVDCGRSIHDGLPEEEWNKAFAEVEGIYGLSK